MARGRGGSGGGGGGDGLTSDDLAWDTEPLIKAQMIVQIIFAVFTLVQLVWLLVVGSKRSITADYKAPFGLLTLSMMLLILGYALDGVAVRYRDVVSFDWDVYLPIWGTGRVLIFQAEALIPATVLYILANHAVALSSGGSKHFAGNIAKRLIDGAIVAAVLIIPIAETGIIANRLNEQYNGSLLAFPNRPHYQRTIYPTMEYGYVEGGLAIVLAVYVLITALALYIAFRSHGASNPFMNRILFFVVPVLIAHAITRLVVEVLEATKSKALYTAWEDNMMFNDYTNFYAYELGSIIALDVLWFLAISGLISAASVSKKVPIQQQQLQQQYQIYPEKPDNSASQTPFLWNNNGASGAYTQPYPTYTIPNQYTPNQYAPPTGPPPSMPKPY
ncbi:hypothetical protein CPB86DRAFT_789214 [Serendipita vermifera]|nr:hypothetical protein CPB86DRAFT_789214 [Serendipita vermifera]